jgi:phage baseplate assembly protein W
MNQAFPFQFDTRGRTARCDDARHVRDLMEQLLFTVPGERVNRPTFGSGLLQLVFATIDDVLTAPVQLSVQGILQQYLGDVLVVEAVEVETVDSTLAVTVRYLVRRTQERQTARFTRGVA